MSKSVYVRVVHDLELLTCSSLCDRMTAGINKVYCCCYPFSSAQFASF